MFQNTKLLVLISLFIILLGSAFLWVGFKSTESKIIPSTSPIIKFNPVSSSVEINATSSSIAGIDGERVLVTDVVDGDTIKVTGGRTVRFVGIDTPETVDPRRPVGCFGKEASNETKRLLTGKIVILQKDVSEKDKYNRLLRLIYLPLDDGQTLFVNDYLVRMGFAKDYRYPPDIKYDEEFKQAENDARQNLRGLWGKC